MLDAAVDDGRLPFVVAMVADAQGVIFEHAVAADGLTVDADSIFWLASMSKAVTATAAMQLVEAGTLALDTPAGDWVPELAAPEILIGFDDDRPMLRPARRTITLRDLLAHTSGHGYAFGHADLYRYTEVADRPARSSGTRAAYDLPLLFEPGSDWLYGVGVDWAGALLEAATGQPLDTLLAERIFAPLSMVDTGFTLDADQFVRTTPLYRRDADGGLAPMKRRRPERAEFFSAGGGLYGTPREYLRFLGALAADGRDGGRRLLAPESVAALCRDQVPGHRAGWIASAQPRVTGDFDITPGARAGWGLGFALNEAATAEGRSPGSPGWAGLANTYYWIDRERGTAAVFMTQLLPFADPSTLALLREFETRLNDGLDRSRPGPTHRD
ncbi:beta-lactamase [Salinisphaera sp. T31B1]